MKIAKVMKGRVIFYSLLMGATAIIMIATGNDESVLPALLVQGFVGLFVLLDDLNDTIKKNKP